MTSVIADNIRDLVVFAIILGGLIFIHELGHFLVALKMGVKVKEFGIGFPPRMVGTVRSKNGGRRLWFWGKPPAEADPADVIYSLNWLPLGGFMRPAGEDDPAIPDGLAASSKFTRFSVLAAGPVANFLAGWLIFAFGFSTGWPSYSNRIQISAVVVDSPADRAGIAPGDIVLTANGEQITAANNRLSEITRSNLGNEVNLTLERNGEVLAVTVVPRTEWPDDQGPMGIVLDREWALTRYNPIESLMRASDQVVFQMRETLMIPVRLISGQVQSSEVRFVSVVGLKTISDAVVDSALEVQSWFPLLQLAGTVSVALGLTNLLPLPALDGGRIMFVVIEALRGRRVDPLREGYVHMMGIFMLLALMAYLIVNDLLNPVQLPR